MNLEWIQVLVSVFTGLATTIPLIIMLVKYVKEAVKERNWGGILDIVMKYMTTAEKKFNSGADRKEWVLAMVKASADTVNYDLDMTTIGELIDSLCKMSRAVNVPKETQKVGSNI